MTDVSSDQHNRHEEEEHLQDTFLSSFIVGFIIILIWLSVFAIYVNRL